MGGKETINEMWHMRADDTTKDTFAPMTKEQWADLNKLRQVIKNG